MFANFLRENVCMCVCVYIFGFCYYEIIQIMCIFLSANFWGFVLAYNTVVDEPFNCCLQWPLGICYASWMNHQQQHVLVIDITQYLVLFEDSVLSFSLFAGEEWNFLWRMLVFQAWVLLVLVPWFTYDRICTLIFPHIPHVAALASEVLVARSWKF